MNSSHVKSTRPRQRRPDWYVELVPPDGGYGRFGLAQAEVDGGVPTASSNAALVPHPWDPLHLAVEYRSTTRVLGHPAVIDSTGRWYRLCPPALPSILSGLHLRRPANLRHPPTVLVVTTLLDLPGKDRKILEAHAESGISNCRFGREYRNNDRIDLRNGFILKGRCWSIVGTMATRLRRSAVRIDGS